MKRIRFCSFILLLLVQQAAAQAPVAAFTSTTPTGCAPLRVAFTDQSSNSPLYWSWDFGNGEFSNLQNPAVTYAQPGTYSVTLTVRNADGVAPPITKTGYIIVSASPTAGLVASSTLGCVPTAIQFTDRSTPNGNPINKWHWDFGDGTTSDEQNPLKTYTAAGFYTISLRVTSTSGCEASRAAARYIRIVDGVSPEFAQNGPASCKPPFNVTFTNQTSGPGTLTYLWTLGNGSTSTATDPPATYNAAGDYTVTLKAKSQYGCEKTISKVISIKGVTTDFTAPASSCLNTPVTFTNASAQTPQSTTWDFGDGTSSDQKDATHTYTAPGTYTVKMVNQYAACTDFVTKSIVVSSAPAISFSASSQISCKAPFAVTFTDASPGANSWLWDFGDGTTSTDKNPTHTYAAEGDYDVSLNITTTSGCTGARTEPAFIQIHRPAVSFSNAPTGGCNPFTYVPKSNIVALDGVRSYQWDFGNGTTSTLPNPPNVTYTTGDYDLTLTVTTNGGCTQTAFLPKGIRVGTPVPASFTASATEACAGASVKFTNLSSPSDEWLWDFGDGTTSSDKNPLHSFRDTGLLTVKLIAFNNKCPGPASTMVFHSKPPVPAFILHSDCTNKGLVKFENKSKYDVTKPVTWSWDFGDPSIPPSTAETPPDARYPGMGPYTVTLRVTQDGCTNVYASKVQFTGEMADFTISPTAACINTRIVLTAINTDPANVNQYIWTVGTNPPIISQRAQTISIPAPGVYNIKFTILDVSGCRTEKTKSITVTGPKARFVPAVKGACKNNLVTFTDLSTSPIGISSWTFDFGDGKTQTFNAPPFTHRYTDTGMYTVKLTVTDKGGCVDLFQYTTPVHITSPVTGFRSDYTTICPGTPVQFTDTSTGIQLKYKWDFGDGSPAITTQDPSHNFTGTDGNNYTVKLVVTDAAACADSVTRIAYIKVRKPKAAFDLKDTTTICPPLRTSFFFKGQDYESFVWDFGDGNTSTLDNPDHFYNQYGTYHAKLSLNGAGTCVETAEHIIRVINPNTSTDIAFGANKACDELTVDFAITTPAYTRFTFVFGDGATDDTQTKNLRHTYNTPNNYRPAVVLKDSQQCQVTVGAAKTISILGAEVLFGMNKKKFCDAGQVFFTDYTRPRQDPIKSKTWDFDDGTTSTADNPSHNFTAPGVYKVKLTATTDFGCQSQMVDTVRVYRTPEPQILGNAGTCTDKELNLKAGLKVSDTFTIWKWDPGASAADNINVKYSQTGTYTIKLEAANMLGCKGNTSRDIIITSGPAIQPGGTQIIPIGGSVTLPMTYTGNIVQYIWAPASSLSCTDCPNPVASPKTDTKYTVQVTDNLGCTNTSAIDVSVQCNDKNYFVPNTFSPNNDGHNDVFYPRGSFVARVNSMKIFNRWGEQIFERRNFNANDASAGWDGTIKGKPANPDVYIYLIEFICENSAIVPFRGNVTLLR